MNSGAQRPRDPALPFDGTAGVRVVALLSAFNEEDVIDQVLAHLIAQGVLVYVIDHGSTDDTAALAEQRLGHGVLQVERFPTHAGDDLSWSAILKRKEALAGELEADWFIHHDADEFRESPWENLRLADAIARVDAAGYNAIDFEVLNFAPTHDRFLAGDDLAEAFRYYSVPASYDRLQIKCWKKTAYAVDLVSDGGHDASFPDRRVFPIRFPVRHYPIRSQKHGERKVFTERRARFPEHERALGWHIQYDGMAEGHDFLKDPASLIHYDADSVRLQVMIRHRGVEALEARTTEAARQAQALRTELASLHSERLGHVQEIERLGTLLAAFQQDTDRLRQDLQQTSAALNAAQAEVQIAAQRADALRGELAAATARIDALLRSGSWRVTAPLRAVLRAIMRITPLLTMLLLPGA